MPDRRLRTGPWPRLGLPNHSMLPLLSGSNPAIDLRRVDLPAPLWPMSATISRSPTSSATPCSTRFLPYPASRSRTLSDMGISEIGLDHARMAADLGGRAGG